MIGEVCHSELDVVPYNFVMSQDMMNKTSRRKQSKPNRLRSNEDGGDPNLAVNSSDAQQMEVDGNDEKDPMDLSMKGPSPPSNIVTAPFRNEINAPGSQIDIVNFPCHTCGDVFPTRAKQEQHLADAHSGEKPHLAALFPTAYHRLATELSLGPGLQSTATLTGNGQESVSQSPQKSGAGGSKALSSGVFQREAYCEICQREFCNKYFLKTHKANIHGIIDPNDPKFAAGSSPKSVPSKSDMQPIEVKSSPSSTVNQKNGSESMEDFCEICQKHFCNKYYLRKHKMDVHNLRPDGKQSSHSGQDNHDNRPPVPVTQAMSHLSMMVPHLSASSMNSMLFVNPFVQSMAAMPYHMMQPQFFLPNSSVGLDPFGNPATLGTTHKDSRSPDASKNTPPAADITDDKFEGEGFCTLCKKEFCNAYFLKVHQASKHGLTDDSALEQKENQQISSSQVDKQDIPGSPDGKPSGGSGDNELIRKVWSSPEPHLNKFSSAFSFPYKLTSSPLTFDAMMAAKQADRITCDICNKEVCNKYFLKAHKQKMHGIMPADDKPKSARITPTNEQTSPEQASEDYKELGLASPLKVDAASVEDASPEGLVRMGIDPEAYCNICKKEFCSKYFLRTHKMNMHGIKADEKTGRTSRASNSQSVSPSSASCAPTLAQTPAPSMPQQQSTGTDTFQWRWKEPALQNKPTPESDKFTWRWKEPANATRVFCDICNKELCNKYFLRTHKLNKHGITDEISASNTPSKPDSDKSVNGESMAANLSAATRAETVNRTASPSALDSLNTQFDQSSPNSRSQTSSPTASERAAMSDDICQICGMVFECKEAVLEHTKCEHMEMVTDKQKVSSQIAYERLPTQLKLHKCSQCDYRSRWLASVCLHEARKHAINEQKPYTCKICHTRFSSGHSLLQHMRKVHHSGRLSKFKNVNHKDLWRREEFKENGVPAENKAFVMQAFTVKDVSGADAFALTTITLPVYKPIRNEISVSFTLVPSNPLPLASDMETEEVISRQT